MYGEHMDKELFMKMLEEMYHEKEVYPLYDMEQEPYPFDMWLADVYQLLEYVAKF